MKHYKRLIVEINSEYKTSHIAGASLNVLKQSISDIEYFDFLTNGVNGGFFFRNSLQVYSLDDVNDYNNIMIINKYMETNYSNMLEGEFFFAQDIFGNQFGFSTKGIVFFNIETGEKEYVAERFNDWIDLIFNDLEYYSGVVILELWDSKKTHINYNERLCPIIPFVVGGEYEIENLYAGSFPNYILANANIANQVYNLPEGTDIQLKPID
ncbi:SMI1/KNR4 family protein [Pedobacter lusitanus]|uniref:SMI1/KNR4 family protein n=1 Tax=Pedobacter lusitanus TaxID=1503925 RepID=UPI0006988A09|nr:SMI1/KNR4 family protein [Pedobacter lusitanus]